MPPFRPTAPGLALTLLRAALDRSQKEAARSAGVTHQTLSRWERGGLDFSPERLAEVAASLPVEPEVAEHALSSTEALLALLPRAGEGDPPGSPTDPTPAERRAIAGASARAGRATFLETRWRLTRAVRGQHARRARELAGEVWREYAGLPPAKRRLLREHTETYRSFALCERLAEESVRAAVDEAGRALELAALALEVAEASPGSEGWRSLLAGHAWAFLGNARRVAGDLPGADAAFTRSRELWAAGRGADPFPLDPTRRLDLEASLRREQERFGEALALLEAILESRPENTIAARLLLNKALTQEQMGDAEAALATLERAAALVDTRAEPRLVFGVLYNLSAGLALLDRHQEAEALIPRVRELALELRSRLDLVRVVWLEAYIRGGTGRLAEAVPALEQVRNEFRARGNAYDAALASLDLAELLLRDGRAGEVARLAREMLGVFGEQGVPEKAREALCLFCRAAGQGRATLELARQAGAALRRARRDPGRGSFG